MEQAKKARREVQQWVNDMHLATLLGIAISELDELEYKFVSEMTIELDLENSSEPFLKKLKILRMATK